MLRPNEIRIEAVRLVGFEICNFRWDHCGAQLESSIPGPGPLDSVWDRMPQEGDQIRWAITGKLSWEGSDDEE